MMSEWMKVMLEEISRKKAEAAQDRVEEQRRHEEQRRREEQRDERRGDEPMAPPRSGSDRL
jgi:hypothetical protein